MFFVDKGRLVIQIKKAKISRGVLRRKPCVSTRSERSRHPFVFKSFSHYKLGKRLKKSRLLCGVSSQICENKFQRLSIFPAQRRFVFISKNSEIDKWKDVLRMRASLSYSTSLLNN
ncbi:hypothetical protein OS493_027621 [Desmophyllum pertusum]|uniref:Uncharacterized protein n=1 Tax=Desmophyllum pertusum TaxID=174260 RepID=A0A9X0D1J3_9CNID|nr:hypothetical protein OS493_027621 [Desmophyllum pertusum]